MTAALALLLLGAGGRPARASGSRDVGTSGAQFLKIVPGARPAGMGAAFAAVDGDVHAVYFNPAGLAAARKVSVTGMHDAYFQDINYEFAAAAVPMLAWADTKREKNEFGTLGLSIYDLSISNLERRGANETDQPSSTFGSSDFAYALSYGVAVPDSGLSLGATAKFIDQNLGGAHASAVASDFGALYRRGSLALGAGMRDSGARPQFAAISDSLPSTVFAGASFAPGDSLLGALELDFPSDNAVSLGLGAEYRRRFIDSLTGAVRLGYNSGGRDGGGLSGTSLGLGIGYGNLSFDFALVPFGELGSTYRYSLTAKF